MDNNNIILEMKSRGWTKDTIKNYIYCISKFNNSKLKPKDYLFSLLKKNKSKSYFKINYSAIKFYYEIQNKKIDFYKENIKLPKKEYKLPKVISKKLIFEMIENTKNIKYKSIIILFYSSGIRLSELINLKFEDMNFKVNTLHIKLGKGNKDRITIFSAKLKKYLKIIKIEENQKLIFLSQRNKKYSPRTIQKIIDIAAKRVKINFKVTPHTLRHSFATHLLESGVDIRYIQELLGHSKLETTSIYTHVANNNLKKIKSPFD